MKTFTQFMHNLNETHQGEMTSYMHDVAGHMSDKEDTVTHHPESSTVGNEHNSYHFSSPKHGHFTLHHIWNRSGSAVKPVHLLVTHNKPVSHEEAHNLNPKNSRSHLIGRRVTNDDAKDTAHSIKYGFNDIKTSIDYSRRD